MRTAILAIGLMLILAGCASTPPVQEASDTQASDEPAGNETSEDTGPGEAAQPEDPAPEPEVPVEPEEPSAVSTSRSSSDLLDDALDEQISDFYRDHSGMFTESVHRWILGPPVDSGSLTTSPASQVRFDGEVIDSIQAAGYIIFEKDGSEDVYGAAVFNSQQTILDGMFSPFDVEISGGRDLGWCRVVQKDVYQRSSGGFVSVYMFGCESASNKE